MSIRLLILFALLFGLVSSAFADPDDLPDTVEIDGTVYTKVIINGEVYYENNGYYYIYNVEMGEMMEAEITFP